MQYSYNQLEQLQKDTENFIIRNDKVKSNIVFDLRKNISKIKEAKKLIEEDFPDVPDKKQKQYQSFLQERNKLIERHGGVFNQTPQGQMQVTNFSSLQQDKKFRDDIQKLQDENQKIIDVIDKTESDIIKIKNKKEVATINDFTTVNINELPETLSFSFTQSMMDFVTNGIVEEEPEPETEEE